MDNLAMRRLTNGRWFGFSVEVGGPASVVDVVEDVEEVEVVEDVVAVSAVVRFDAGSGMTKIKKVR